MRFLQYLIETGFRKAADRDYPAGIDAGVIFFSKSEIYKVEGKTHGLLSHAIKHLREFEPAFVDSVISKMRKFLKTQHCFFNIHNNINPAYNYDFSENTILNTLDMINDKKILNKQLYAPEKILYTGALQLDVKYKEFINKITQGAVFIKNDFTDKKKILEIMNSHTIKYFVIDHNATLVHLYNKKLDALVITLNGDISSCYKLHKPGFKYDWYRGKKFLNPVLGEIMKTHAYLN